MLSLTIKHINYWPFWPLSEVSSQRIEQLFHDTVYYKASGIQIRVCPLSSLSNSSTSIGMLSGGWTFPPAVAAIPWVWWYWWSPDLPWAAAACFVFSNACLSCADRLWLKFCVSNVYHCNANRSQLEKHSPVFTSQICTWAKLWLKHSLLTRLEWHNFLCNEFFHVLHSFHWLKWEVKVLMVNWFIVFVVVSR